MKKLITAGLLILGIYFTLYAQKKDQVLLKIAGNPVTLDEFQRIYLRNNSNIQDPENKKTAGEYLQLFINFKLKVLEAMQSGLDTSKAFKTELAGYRTELAAPYLTDSSFDAGLVEETYRRMTKEVSAAHIMIALPENFTPVDSLTAFNKISEIRSQIVNGLDFHEAAVNFSQDPSSQTNKGELPWFTVFQMVYPFENAAYTTPVGQISQPFRTRFGYHILKVNDIRDSKGEIHVSHIMKLYPQNATPEQKKKTLQSADSIYEQLLNGLEFAQLASQLSEDRQSAEKGGELPWFSRSRMIPSFADPAFSLQNDGDISKPIDSGIGYHIIKRLGAKPVPDFKEIKRELETKIKSDAERNTQSRKTFVSKLKQVYNFESSQQAINEIMGKSSKWLRDSTSLLPQNDKTVLFSFSGNTYTADDWIKYLQAQKQSILPDDPKSLGEKFYSWENEMLLNYEDKILEEKHPDFKSLMQEYHDGMLLFTISENNIWQKASSDTSGLKKFYEINKQKYLWPQRYKGRIVRCNYPDIREEVEKYLEMKIPVSEIQDMLHIPQEYITITEGAWTKGENPIIDYYIWKGPMPEGWNNNTGFVMGEITDPEPKALNESRGYHIADYQQYLDELWIKELRKKYPVKINKKLMKSMANE